MFWCLCFSLTHYLGSGRLYDGIGIFSGGLLYRRIILCLYVNIILFSDRLLGEKEMLFVNSSISGWILWDMSLSMALLNLGSKGDNSILSDILSNWLSNASSPFLCFSFNSKTSSNVWNVNDGRFREREPFAPMRETGVTSWFVNWGFICDAVKM